MRADRVSDGGCFGSVLLENTLWQSLGAMHGRDVPWVYGCILEHGHHGDHGAPACDPDDEPQQWLRWPDNGPARLEPVESSPPGRHSMPTRSAPDSPIPSPVTTAHAHNRGHVESPPTESHEAALWAIATAIERLADAVSRLGKPSHDEGTH